MKKWVFFLIFIFISSCIPYSKAPDIEGTRLVHARQFKSDLPDVYALVFENPYGIERFNDFLRQRFQWDGGMIHAEIPFEVNEHRYLLSIHECKRYDRAINLFSGIVDDLIWDSDDESDFEFAEMFIEEDNALFDDYEQGYLYIALTVADTYGRDALDKEHPEHNKVLGYLRLLHYDYVNPAADFLWPKDTLMQEELQKPLSLSDKF